MPWDLGIFTSIHTSVNAAKDKGNLTMVKVKTITDISGYLTCRGSQICFVEASSRFMFYSKEMEQNNDTFYNIYGGQSAHPRALLSKQCDNRQLHVLLGEMETCL